MERVRRSNGLAKIRVIGIGGGGCNAVNRMAKAKIKDVELVALNTDAQVLSVVEAHKTLQIGVKLTGGLGAGGNPETGRKAAEESESDIRAVLEDVDMVFITTGMGGGTGTGGAPVVARLARELGILSVGIVTKPFSFEGPQRIEKAKKGIEELRQYVDTMIAIPNDRILKVAPADLPLLQAFELADDVLRQGVQGITDLITTTGLINRDFADIEATMRGAGTAMMGIGEGEGEGRTREAARAAITSPLLEGSIEGAQRVILSITGGYDLTLEEVTEAAQLIREAVSENADIFFGATVKEGYERLKITLIATGFKEYEDHEYDEFEPIAIEPEDEEELNGKHPSREKTPPTARKRDSLGDWDVPTFIRRRGKGREEEDL
ncbi:cell division protein FtsZ [Candidatus Acetothermia bacterium]|nr:cell division protein FtsZ [Candidatus Acetothermia bacterium]MBI3642508.1 cell division protein FtsZ [Candidatus Acetothermia bacterium]